MREKEKGRKRKMGERREEAPRCAFFLSAMPAIIYARFRAVHNGKRLFMRLWANAPASLHSNAASFLPCFGIIMTSWTEDEFISCFVAKNKHEILNQGYCGIGHYIVGYNLQKIKASSYIKRYFF